MMEKILLAGSLPKWARFAVLSTKLIIYLLFHKFISAFFYSLEGPHKVNTDLWDSLFGRIWGSWQNLSSEPRSNGYVSRCDYHVADNHQTFSFFLFRTHRYYSVLNCEKYGSHQSSTPRRRFLFELRKCPAYRSNWPQNLENRELGQIQLPRIFNEWTKGPWAFEEGHCTPSPVRVSPNCSF